MLSRDEVHEIVGRYLDDSDIVEINSIEEICPSFIKKAQRDYSYLNGAELGQLITAFAELIGNMLGERGKQAVEKYKYPQKKDDSRRWIPDFQDEGIPDTVPTQPGWERKTPSVDIEYDPIGKTKDQPYLGKNPGAASMLEPTDLHMPAADLDTIVDEIAIEVEEGYVDFDEIGDYLEEKYSVTDQDMQDEIIEEIKEELENV